jgi:Zn-dependent protease
VLVHEVGHAVVARRAGVAVRGVSLFLFGGYTEMVGEPERPSADLAVALAGPLASLGMAAALGLLRWPFLGLLPGAADVLGLLVVINLGAVAFNLLPGLPLDGGRIVRALYWRSTGDRVAGGRVAAVAGRVLGALLVAGGVAAAVVWRSPVPLAVGAVGWFVHAGAAAELRAADVLGTPVGTVMTAPASPVGPGDSVESGPSWVPVVDEARVVGLIAPGVSGTSGEVMVLIEPDDVVDAGLPLGEALAKIERTGRAVVVVAEGRMVGVLAPERLADVLEAMQRRQDTD